MITDKTVKELYELKLYQEAVLDFGSFTITVQRRADDWMAYIDGNKGNWCCGSSLDYVVGYALITLVGKDVAPGNPTPAGSVDVGTLVAEARDIRRRKAECDAVCDDPAKRGTMEHRVADDTRHSLRWKLAALAPRLLDALLAATEREQRVRAAVAKLHADADTVEVATGNEPPRVQGYVIGLKAAARDIERALDTAERRTSDTPPVQAPNTER